MSNFQSKTKELVNTATAAGALYKGTPEQQFREMGQAAKRLYPGEENETKLQRSINRADIVGQIYGVQWTRNKLAQERITKLLEKADSIIAYKSDPEFEGYKSNSFINLVSQRNRIASQFGLSPMSVGDYIGMEEEDKQKSRPYIPDYEPYHIQTKTDDKGHMVEKTVSESKQSEWNMDMIMNGKNRYQGKKADAIRTVLQRRFAKMPNPMTVAQFKGGPEW